MSTLPSLKGMLLKDNDMVFLNPKGFSEKMELEYQGKTYQVWVLIEEEGTAVRDKNNYQRKNDHEKALYQYDKYLWINKKDLGFTPKAMRYLKINGVKYQIREVSVEFGVIELTVRRLME